MKPSMSTSDTVIKKRKKMNLKRKETIQFFICIAPWLIGFICLTLGPMIISLYMSFTNWDMFSDVEFIGLQNYTKLFNDKIFVKSVINTFIYALISVPLGMFLSLIVAYMLNLNVKGIKWFRTIFYLPCVIPVVASSLIFTRMLAPSGVINQFLSIFGVAGPAWLLNKDVVLYSFIFMALWGVGGNMILLLAGMQGIPDELYEAGLIDGANRRQLFTYITIPQLTPVIFFNLIMGVIGSLQAFSQIYIMTGGGPDNGSMMIVPYLYQTGFVNYRMGYASSMAWVLFVIVLILSMIVFKSSSLWVFYEGEVKK